MADDGADPADLVSSIAQERITTHLTVFLQGDNHVDLVEESIALTSHHGGVGIGAQTLPHINVVEQLRGVVGVELEFPGIVFQGVEEDAVDA